MSIYFIADTHFGHTNVIQHDARPFKSIEEHDNTLIANWNNAVKKDDIVYHLGDFFWTKKSAKNILPILHGRIKLIEGNHDCNWLGTKLKAEHPNLEMLPLIAELKMKIGDRPEYFVMCHYPMQSWNYQRYLSKHLFGHIHSDALDSPITMCVSANLIDYTPMSLEKLLSVNGWN